MADTILSPKNGATPATAGTENAMKPTHTKPVPLKPNNPFDLFGDRITQTPAYRYLYGNNIQKPANQDKQQYDRTGQIKKDGNTPNPIDFHAVYTPTVKPAVIATAPTPQTQTANADTTKTGTQTAVYPTGERATTAEKNSPVAQPNYGKIALIIGATLAVLYIIAK